jgi:hypothetical protein
MDKTAPSRPHRAPLDIGPEWAERLMAPQWQAAETVMRPPGRRRTS